MRHFQHPSGVFTVLALAAVLATASATAQATVDSMLASGSYALNNGVLTSQTASYPALNPVDVLAYPSSGASSALLHSYGSTSGNFGNRSSGNGVYNASGAFNISETITNNSLVAQAATFNFFITPGMLANFINSPLTGTEFLTSGINFNILRDGSNVWNSAATLTSNAFATTFSATGDIGLYSGGGTYYAINGVSRSINLGILNPNQSLNLSYTLASFAQGNSSVGPGMFVPAVTTHVPGQWIIRHCKDRNGVGTDPGCVEGEQVYIPAHDVVVPEHTIPAGMTSGSHGSSGDPFNIDFNGNPVFSGTAFDPKGANVVLSAVPEPATSALLLAALGVLGFMTRRKSGNGIAK